jgi:hypothetical protein
VTVDSSASDSGSGLAEFYYSLDGGALQPWSGPLTLGDGVHTIDLTAVDGAGNNSTASQTVYVDTAAPSVALGGGGAASARPAATHSRSIIPRWTGAAGLPRGACWWMGSR